MNDKELKSRIVKGKNAINKANKKGIRTTNWELHLASLKIKYYKSILKNRKIRVKVGPFGFCTCFSPKHDNALCSGCYKIKASCNCKTISANPRELLNIQYENELNNSRKNFKKTSNKFKKIH